LKVPSELILKGHDMGMVMMMMEEMMMMVML
jgi:hypothetical protein